MDESMEKSISGWFSRCIEAPARVVCLVFDFVGFVAATQASLAIGIFLLLILPATAGSTTGNAARSFIVAFTVLAGVVFTMTWGEVNLFDRVVAYVYQ